MSGDGQLYLSDEHLGWLAASGVTEEHARRRGYRTVRWNDEADRCLLLGTGFTKRQYGRIEYKPGLLIPLLDKRGGGWGWQLRNFTPDTGLDSLWAKYHSPPGQFLHVDVPPGVGEMLEDPEEPLWVTEGTKKADCAVLQGLCCVALLGVWGWRGRNDWDSVTALADWEEVAFKNCRTGKGRKVIVAFDGDIMRKEGVRQATLRFCKWLDWRGADPHVLLLPDKEDKIGLDDFLMGGGS